LINVKVFVLPFLINVKYPVRIS